MVPFNYDETNPDDDDVVASYPANERAHRETVKDVINVDHDADTGFLTPTGMDRAARDALVAGDKPSGRLIWRTDVSTFERWNGATWDRLSDAAGVVKLFAGATVPTGFLECNGAEVPKSTYADLWDSFGGQLYGTPSNPTSNFLLPDFRGKTFIGMHTGGDGVGDYGVIGVGYGEKKHPLTAAEMVTINASGGGHSHGVPATGGPSTTVSAATGTGVAAASGSHTHSLIDGGAHTHAYDANGVAHENRQPSIVQRVIIKT